MIEVSYPNRNLGISRSAELIPECNSLIGCIESGFKSPPEIETCSGKEQKKIESIFDEQLIDIAFHGPHYERPQKIQSP
jgi:hypothetical protein